MKYLLLVLFIQCFIITVYAQQDTKAIISVDPGPRTGKISLPVFGQFVEYPGR